MHTESYTFTAIIIDISDRKCCDVCSDKQVRGKENMAEAERGSEFSFKEAGIVLSVAEEQCS